MPIALNDNEGLEKIIRRALGEPDSIGVDTGLASAHAMTLPQELSARLKRERAQRKAEADASETSRAAATEAEQVAEQTAASQDVHDAHEAAADPISRSRCRRDGLKAALVAALRDDTETTTKDTA